MSDVIWSRDERKARRAKGIICRIDEAFFGRDVKNQYRGSKKKSHPKVAIHFETSHIKPINTYSTNPTVIAHNIFHFSTPLLDLYPLYYETQLSAMFAPKVKKSLQKIKAPMRKVKDHSAILEH